MGLRILGIDPGLNVTGYGVIDDREGKPALIEGGVIRTSAKSPLEQRLVDVFLGIEDLLKQFEPNAVALEEVYTHYDRPRVAVMMGHARGVICLAASLSQVPVFSYASTHIKAALTGNGRASKEQLQRMVQTCLDLESAPSPLDVTDALAAALCHLVQNSRVRAVR